uniref:Uncharacterized protein n=1 Tax=Anopheles atroparvus TaxID=41427 RepID=A0A182J108_ANOAO
MSKGSSGRLISVLSAGGNVAILAAPVGATVDSGAQDRTALPMALFILETPEATRCSITAGISLAAGTIDWDRLAGGATDANGDADIISPLATSLEVAVLEVATGSSVAAPAGCNSGELRSGPMAFGMMVIIVFDIPAGLTIALVALLPGKDFLAFWLLAEILVSAVTTGCSNELVKGVDVEDTSSSASGISSFMGTALILIRLEVRSGTQALLALFEHDAELIGDGFVLEAHRQLLRLAGRFGVVYRAPNERLAGVVHRRDGHVGRDGVVQDELVNLLTPQQQSFSSPAAPPPSAPSSAVPLLPAPSVLLFSLAAAEREKKSSFTVSPTKPPPGVQLLPPVPAAAAAAAVPVLVSSPFLMKPLKAGLPLARAAKLTLSSMLSTGAASAPLVKGEAPPPVADNGEAEKLVCFASPPKVNPPPPNTDDGFAASPNPPTLPNSPVPGVPPDEVMVVELGTVTDDDDAGGVKRFAPPKMFVVLLAPDPNPAPLPKLTAPNRFPPWADFAGDGVVRVACWSSEVTVVVVPDVDNGVLVTLVCESVFLSTSPPVEGGEVNDVFGVVFNDAEKMEPPPPAVVDEPIPVEPRTDR